MSITILPSSHRAEPHTATQARMLDRLADLYLEQGDVDRAAHCIFERAIITGSSVTAPRFSNKENVNS